MVLSSLHRLSKQRALGTEVGRGLTRCHFFGPGRMPRARLAAGAQKRTVVRCLRWSPDRRASCVNYLSLSSRRLELRPRSHRNSQNRTYLSREIVQGMPKSDKQEVRVLTATIQPGGKTPFHTHRFPVTVYILEGTFTLELEGRLPVVLKAGESHIEPPNVKMTGYNKSPNEPMRVVIFYVSDPDTPFLDMVHGQH